MIVGNHLHIATDSVKIIVPEIEKDAAVIWVEGKLKNQDNRNHSVLLKSEIFGPDNEAAAEETNICCKSGRIQRPNFFTDSPV